jgi:hypothetical protein
MHLGSGRGGLDLFSKASTWEGRWISLVRWRQYGDRSQTQLTSGLLLSMVLAVVCSGRAAAASVVSVATTGASMLLRVEIVSPGVRIAKYSGRIDAHMSFLGSSTMFRPLTPSVNLLTSSVTAGLTVSSETTAGAVAVEVEASGATAISVFAASVAVVVAGVTAATLEEAASVCIIVQVVLSVNMYEIEASSAITYLVNLVLLLGRGDSENSGDSSEDALLLLIQTELL